MFDHHVPRGKSYFQDIAKPNWTSFSCSPYSNKQEHRIIPKSSTTTTTTTTTTANNKHQTTTYQQPATNNQQQTPNNKLQTTNNNKNNNNTPLMQSFFLGPGRKWVALPVEVFRHIHAPRPPLAQIHTDPSQLIRGLEVYHIDHKKLSNIWK